MKSDLLGRFGSLTFDEDELSCPTSCHGILSPLHQQHHKMLNIFVLINYKTALISSLIHFSSWSLPLFCPNRNFHRQELIWEASELTQTTRYTKAAWAAHETACIRCVESKEHPGHSLALSHSPSVPQQSGHGQYQHNPAIAVATTHGQAKCSCLGCGDLPPFTQLWNTRSERTPFWKCLW